MAEENTSFDIDVSKLDLFFTGDGAQTDIRVKHTSTESVLPNLCVSYFIAFLER